MIVRCLERPPAGPARDRRRHPLPERGAAPGRAGRPRRRRGGAGALGGAAAVPAPGGWRSAGRPGRRARVTPAVGRLRQVEVRTTPVMRPPRTLCCASRGSKVVPSPRRCASRPVPPVITTPSRSSWLPHRSGRRRRPVARSCGGRRRPDTSECGDRRPRTPLPEAARPAPTSRSDTPRARSSRRRGERADEMARGLSRFTAVRLARVLGSRPMAMRWPCPGPLPARLGTAGRKRSLPPSLHRSRVVGRRRLQHRLRSGARRNGPGRCRRRCEREVRQDPARHRRRAQGVEDAAARAVRGRDGVEESLSGLRSERRVGRRGVGRCSAARRRTHA